ncbi:MAG: DUF2590 family protein [Cellvibrionaceae bacterium]
MTQKHIDLHVVDGDFVIDPTGFSQPVSDRQSIGQDIKHRIIETGLLPLLIGQRSPIERDSIINRLKIEIDKDTRLQPGTVRFLEVENQPGSYYVTAVTLEFSDLAVYL